ncbi:hypothetical protein EYF80_032237 [Liparis tanakae]|uniref:Uncharacterized protein n=1 Tax=Liparis tanakae TaxID=230148 RepID=A0A4Z2GXL4_9TELE|nr:hypothetical protein EYF80_032237 [Liparis tanakae]
MISPFQLISHKACSRFSGLSRVGEHNAATAVTHAGSGAQLRFCDKEGGEDKETGEEEEEEKEEEEEEEKEDQPTRYSSHGRRASSHGSMPERLESSSSYVIGGSGGAPVEGPLRVHPSSIGELQHGAAVYGRDSAMRAPLCTQAIEANPTAALSSQYTAS